MANLSLEELQRRVAQQHEELQLFQRELETRRNRLAELTRRKQELLTHLQQVELEMTSVAAGIAPSKAAPSKTSPKNPTTKASPVSKRDRPSLHALIVTMIREVGRPLTVSQLAAEAKKRGFQSSSGNFARLVKNRVYILKKKGILEKPANQPGFILAQSSPGQASKAGQTKSKASAANQKVSVSASKLTHLERALIRERTRAAMNVKRERRERISFQEPYGWDFEGNGLLVENAREQEAIAWIKCLRAEGKSLRQIAELLNNHGYKPKQGKGWRHTSVMRILARPPAADYPV